MAYISIEVFPVDYFIPALNCQNGVIFFTIIILTSISKLSSQLVLSTGLYLISDRQTDGCAVFCNNNILNRHRLKYMRRVGSLQYERWMPDVRFITGHSNSWRYCNNSAKRQTQCICYSALSFCLSLSSCLSIQATSIIVIKHTRDGSIS